MQIGNGEFLLGDCLERMSEIPDGSVDMVLCDLPYGTTACKWDSIIPFEPLWEHYWRVLRKNGAVVLTAAQPFTSALVMSQIDRFKYEWIWRKNMPSGFAAAKYRPMSNHESCLIFATSKTLYNKQPTKTLVRDRKLGGSNGKRWVGTGSEVYGGLKPLANDVTLNENVSPRTVLEINCEPRSKGSMHPTQKPVALFEYLIRTYTDEGMTVLDNCAGSGTTAIAAERTGRRWICIEREPTYYYPACGRVWREVQSAD